MCFFIIKNDDDFLGVASAGLFNVEVEKIKDTNEIVQSGLSVVPEFPFRHSFYGDHTCSSCNYNSCQDAVAPSNGEDVLDTSSQLFYVR